MNTNKDSGFMPRSRSAMKISRTIFTTLAMGLAAVMALQDAAARKIEVTQAMCRPEKEAAQVWNAFDGSVETHVDSAACTHAGVGVQFEQPKKVTYVRVHSRLGWASRLQNGRIEGSTDGKKWTRLFEMGKWDAFPERRWIQIPFDAPAEYAFYRLVGVDDGNVAEIEWHEGAVPEKTADYVPLPAAPFVGGKRLAVAEGAVTILPPSYRGMVSTARRDPAVRFGYLLNPNQGGVPGLDVKTVVKDASGKTVAEGSFTTTSETPAFFSVALPADAPAGNYALVATFATAKGRKEVSAKFKIVPVRPKQFFVDQDGTILKEGKPFFPLGLHHAHGWQIDEWLPMGVNMIQMWSWDWNQNFSTNETLWAKPPANDAERKEMTEQRIDRLRKLEENDIYMIYEDGAVWNDLILQTYGKFGPAAEWETTPYPFETNVAMRARILAVLNDPLSRVGMWYLADEVGGGGWVPKLQRAGKYFHDLDEDHPTFNLSAGDHSTAAGGDVYSFDCYPRYYGGTGELTRISRTMEAAWKQVGAHQPIIVVPQAFGQSEKQPTELPEHVRAMSYLGIVRGAKGMFWYCWKQTGDWSGSQKQGMGWNPPTAELVKQVIAEFKVFSQALLVPGAKHLTSADGLVLAILAGDDATGRFLVYVNGDLTKASDSTIEVSLPDGAILEPLFGGPKASLKGGKVALKAPALATGAFRVTLP